MVRSCGSASTLLPCGGIGPPWCLPSVPAVRPSASILPPCGFLLAFYRPAVDIVLPLRLSSAPAVLLALYCRAVDIGPPLRLWFVPAVLLALYCRAVDNGPPLRLSFVYWPAWVSFRPAVRSCWLCYFSDVAFIRRLRFLLALYCRAVDIGPPLRLSSVPTVLLALYRRAVSCWHSIALRW